MTSPWFSADGTDGLGRRLQVRKDIRFIDQRVQQRRLFDSPRYDCYDEVFLGTPASQLVPVV